MGKPALHLRCKCKRDYKRRSHEERRTVEVFLQDGGQVTLRLLAFVFALAMFTVFTREESANVSASQVQENGHSIPCIRLYLRRCASS